MTWEQLSLFTDKELGLQGPKEIEKTVAIQMAELREQIARELEDKLFRVYPFHAEIIEFAAEIARGQA